MDTQPGETPVWGEGPAAPGANLEVPQDICDWASPSDLISWIQEELKAMSALEPKDSPTSAILADRMLAVLALAYSRGTYDGEEIADLSRSDPLFRSVSGGLISTSEVLSFRSKHRDLLVKVIVQLLIKATRQKFNISVPALPPVLRKRLQGDANDRLDNARQFDRGEEV